MGEDVYNFRKLLKKKEEEDEARRAEEAAGEKAPLTPEEQARADVDTVRRITAGILGVPRPPGYAKALCKNHAKAQSFARRVQQRIGDPEVVRRFVNEAELLDGLRQEMAEASRTASNPKAMPIVCTPFGVFAQILGEDYEKPDDGEHWPLHQPEGPITWED